VRERERGVGTATRTATKTEAEAEIEVAEQQTINTAETRKKFVAQTLALV